MTKSSFNRTAYGIETANIQLDSAAGDLLIAPLMELKLKKKLSEMNDKEFF